MFNLHGFVNRKEVNCHTFGNRKCLYYLLQIRQSEDTFLAFVEETISKLSQHFLGFQLFDDETLPDDNDDEEDEALPEFTNITFNR